MCYKKGLLRMQQPFLQYIFQQCKHAASGQYGHSQGFCLQHQRGDQQGGQQGNVVEGKVHVAFCQENIREYQGTKNGGRDKIQPDFEPVGNGILLEDGHGEDPRQETGQGHDQDDAENIILVHASVPLSMVVQDPSSGTADF